MAGIVCFGMLTHVLAAAEYPARRGQVRRVQYCPPGCQPQYPYSQSQPGVMTVPSETNPQNSTPSNPPGSAGTAPPMPSVPAPMNTPFPDQNFNNNAPQPNFNPAPQNNAIASTNTSGFGSQAPNMIGDYFGTFGSSFDPIIGGGGFPPASPDITGNLGGAPGSNVGRVKLAENVSPIPRDRVFVNYSYFNDVNIAGGGIDVHRVTPGFEKTFLNGNASIELRTPFADTVSSTITPAGPQTSATEFGNMTVWMKALLISGDQGGLATGLGLALPTADDYVVDNGGASLAVNNSAVHYLPYIGGVYTPDDRWFTQGLMQLDFDGSGNRVYTGDLAAPTLEGRAKDNTYLFLDVSVGYWVYKTNHRHDTIQGIAPVIEVHHNTSLGRGSAFEGVNFDLEAPGSQHVTNMVFGINTKIHNGKSLTFGYVTPVGGDDQFDKEFRVMFNWIPGT